MPYCAALSCPFVCRAEMPLLNNVPFVKAAPPTKLRADEEVFYCSMTHEIFRDYE